MGNILHSTEKSDTIGGSRYLIDDLAFPPTEVDYTDDEPMYFNDIFFAAPLINTVENALLNVGPYQRGNSSRMNESMNMHSYGDIHARVVEVNANIPIQFIYNNWKQQWNLKSPNYIKKQIL